MPSVSDSLREAAYERVTARTLHGLTDRVLTECVLPAWVVYIVALCRLRAVVLAFSRTVRSKSLQRRLVCFAIMFSFLLWPGPGLFTKRAIAATLLVAKTVEARVSRIVRSDEAYLLASLVSENINRNSLYVSPNSAATLASMFLQSSNPPHHETMQDRANAVAHIRISPVKLVGYENESLIFGAVATDSSNKIIQGVKFSWSSSDTNKLQINEAGQARFLQPGLAKVVCRPGLWK